VEITDAVLRDAGISAERAAEATFMRGKGCSHCQKNGYRGRIGIIELMRVTALIRDLIFNNKSAEEIRKAALGQGLKTLYQDGLLKVLDGITTLDEVYRVAKRSDTEINMSL
jgi:type IV pilus assembly protein PilB